MAKTINVVQLAKDFLRHLESEGKNPYRGKILSSYGSEIGYKLVIQGEPPPDVFSDPKEELIRHVDPWQKERNLDLSEAQIKKVADEVLHYAKDKTASGGSA